jgi:FkbM family methyltransferase
MKPYSFRSLKFIDLPSFLEINFFPTQVKGTFVEFGAYDGLFDSCTKHFEDLGWTGLCIEPLPHQFEKLKQNRKAICIQGCIDATERIGKFFKINPPGPEYRSGLIDRYDPHYYARIQYEQAMESATSDIIEIECKTLNRILTKHGIADIDLLSIDTEGGELKIIQSINFKKFDINVIVIENHNDDENIPNYLISLGYNFVFAFDSHQIFTKYFRIRQ